MAELTWGQLADQALVTVGVVDEDVVTSAFDVVGKGGTGQLKLDELVTTTYTLDQVNQGYQDLRDGKNIRGVIRYDLD